MAASNIQVAIKVRPIDPIHASKWEIAGNSIKLVDGGGPEPFYFDHIFDQDVSNQVIFETIAKQIVAAGFKGFNGTIFAYGQTSSGKTYTMMGDEKDPGVMVLAAKKIFREIENSTDWQFLLRVSYIEIYNEKIHDLLNKSNTDLKIYETSNGEVAVNCSENIITCEEDLLGYLREGSKSRKIGETQMNERSSRSHAIFRIIIESRKIDQTDEDSVQISVLNLVDLAGSERADQTGATGSRLKEGSHINKSLLFLGRVIKQLAEGKYVSYRDSKLTRILQASLGGNALTAIICTINPTVVDESLSTLNFANRAKVIKNKPQVNEVVSDSAMMKRLVKKIDALTTELEVEKTKNSQIKVTQLQKLLNEEIHKIINSNSVGSLKASNKNRRRTWCPSSMIPPLAEETPARLTAEASNAELPFASKIPPPTKLPMSKTGFNFTPLITVRNNYYQEKFDEIECSPSIDEEFIPGEDVCFSDMITPQTSPTGMPKLSFKTPTTSSDFKLRASLTPKLTEQQSLEKMEQELEELQRFTNLENKLNVEHDTYNTLKFKLENAERRIAGYEKEREHFAFLKVEYSEAQTNLANYQERCEQLESKVKGLEESSGKSSDRINRYEQEVTNLKDKINHLEMENRRAVGLEFEFEQHKNKSKRRETELLEALEEKHKEIIKLERSLQTLTNDMLNNSKEEIQQIARNLNESDSTCPNCKDLQRIVSSKQQLIEEFGKAKLENQKLQSSIERISAEAESAKLRADYLETENCNLKKDIENFTSLNGSLEKIREEIVSLQEEKCKLETIKIEFEVLSKEVANKTAEKINIGQEVQSLITHRDNFAFDCDKLQTEIKASNCTKEELEKIRTENEFLNAELKNIKTKLESTEQQHLKLMAENQSKSESFEKLNMEVTVARNQLHTLQDKYDQIQAECNKHEGTIGEIQSEYDAIQSKYQCLQKEYEKLESDSVQSFADCDRVQAQNKNLETEIHDLKAKVEEAQRKLLENDYLQSELELLKSEMNRLQGEQQKGLESIESQNGCDLKSENLKLKEEMKNIQLRYDEMQKDYDDISTQIMDYISDNESLQAEINKMKSETSKQLSPDDLEAIKTKSSKLEETNTELLRENVEFKKTVAQKCDESESLVAQLETIKNNSFVNDLINFIQLASSFIEIEITLENGGSRIFQAIGYNKSTNGTRLIIGNIYDIRQGTFNEYCGSIEFAISADIQKINNDIFDSLEMDKQTISSPNSCDSLEVPCNNNRQSDEAQLNELIEEKAKLVEKTRELQETVSILKTENADLANTRQQLEETRHAVEQLNNEKFELSTICEENKCKISEMSEIISRSESENMKLIADCEKLKKAVESESAEVSDRQNNEMGKEMEIVNECKNCRELREQISALTVNVSLKLESSEIKPIGEEAQNNSKIGELIEEKSLVNLKINGDSEFNVPSQNGSTSEEQILCLEEEIKIHKCKYQEVLNDFNDLRKKFDEQAQASANAAIEFEEINSKFKKLQTEYDELLSFERMKSTELEESAARLETLNGEIALLQQTVADLKESVTLVEGERNEILLKKKNLEELKSELSEKVQSLEKDKYVMLEEKNDMLQKLAALEQERNSHMEDCKKLKEQLKKVIEENNESETTEMVRLRDVLKNNAADKLLLEETLRNLSGELLSVSAEKKNLQNDLENLKQMHQGLKEINSVERKDLQEKITTLKKQIEELTESKRGLGIALEKAKEHSEFILQQGKNMEEQLNFDISAAAEANLRMSEEITELKEKLHAAGSKLEKVSEEINFEKDQLKVELTSKNNSLLNKVSELESELVASKKCQLNEVKLKEALEGQCEELLKAKNLLVTKCEEIEEKCKNLEEQIKETTEMLSNTKEQLVLSQVECSQKDEKFSCLSQKYESLVAKTVSLEENLSTLEDDLTKSKQDLSQEILKKDDLNAKVSELQNKIVFLENQFAESRTNVEESSNKDKLISELSKTNESLISKNCDLEVKLSLLEKQFDESKRCETVLENAKTERDDLIVQLTKNNNFLTTKKSELEAKLAILENQFEESKRHLSAEVNRLNKTLSETNDASHLQNSKIEDLLEKIKSFEDEINIAHKTSLERDSLLQKIDEFKEKYDSLARQNANLEMTKSTYEAELNSARVLNKQVNELQSSLNEIQLKYDSLSIINRELEFANQRLTKALEDTTQRAEDCNRLKCQIASLHEAIEKERQLNNELKAELNGDSKDRDSKMLLLTNKISQLEADKSSLTFEKTSLQKEYEDSVKNSSNKITQLEQQIKSLQKGQSLNTSLRSSLSPKKEKNMDHWMSENHQTKIKNTCLMDKLDSNQKSTPKEERKNRRLSTHDERRIQSIQSFWDVNRDVSTMTDPPNTECSCMELNEKLNELKQRLLIRDSQVNTLNMEIKNHPLKTEYASLKKLFSEEEAKQQELRKELKKYKSLIANRTNESRHCAKCYEFSKKIFVSSFSQTTESDESESYHKLLSKYNDLKEICRMRRIKVEELKEALSKGKENANDDNISSISNQHYRQKYEQVKKELSLVQQKYEEAKTLCNKRFEQLNVLQQSGNT